MFFEIAQSQRSGFILMKITRKIIFTIFFCVRPIADISWNRKSRTQF